MKISFILNYQISRDVSKIKTTSSLLSRLSLSKKPLINNIKMLNTDIIDFKNLTNPLPGSELGIPLSIFSYGFTNLHYGFNIIDLKVIVIQVMVGFICYGGDRYLDALEYQEELLQDKDNRIEISENKKELYNYLLINDNLIKKLIISNIFFNNIFLVLKIQQSLLFQYYFQLITIRILKLN